MDSLINLQNLNLAGNQIVEIKGLDSLTNLQELHLDNNQIREIKGLDSLINLQELHLDSNQIVEIKGIYSLTNLETLNLYNNQIKEIKGLDSLTNLQNLNLYDNPVKDYANVRGGLLRRNMEIQWPIVKPQFIEHCLGLASLDLSVDQVIMIFDANSYPNHLYKKWQIAKVIKDTYAKKIKSKGARKEYKYYTLA